MRGVRVVMEPLFNGSERDELRSDHCRVALSALGPPNSKLKPKEKLDAELTYHLAFLTLARKVSEPEFAALARVKGEIERDDKGALSLTLPADWDYELLSAEEADDPARHLLLKYGAGFVDKGRAKARKLVLPKVPEDTRFLELGVELAIAGATEAPLAIDDVLDIPLRLVPADVSDRLRLAVCMQYDDFRLANRSYKLTVNGEDFFGVIPSSGEIVLPKKVTSGTGTLEVLPFEASSRSYKWELEIGKLQPVDAVPGVQARLNGQGFAPGAIDGNAGPKTEQALRSFQHRHALLADGTISDATKQKLTDVFGC
ncbi:MAG: peptidoglycan-binding protein [Myxococcota bacterium]|nr:peptidoglycan-binding protein [Myxococcota bacterium]